MLQPKGYAQCFFLCVPLFFFNQPNSSWATAEYPSNKTTTNVASVQVSCTLFCFVPKPFPTCSLKEPRWHLPCDKPSLLLLRLSLPCPRIWERSLPLPVIFFMPATRWCAQFLARIHLVSIKFSWRIVPRATVSRRISNTATRPHPKKRKRPPKSTQMGEPNLEAPPRNLSSSPEPLRRQNNRGNKATPQGNNNLPRAQGG